MFTLRSIINHNLLLQSLLYFKYLYFYDYHRLNLFPTINQKMLFIQFLKKTIILPTNTYLAYTTYFEKIYSFHYPWFSHKLTSRTSQFHITMFSHKIFAEPQQWCSVPDRPTTIHEVDNRPFEIASSIFTNKIIPWTFH